LAEGGQNEVRYWRVRVGGVLVCSISGDDYGATRLGRGGLRVIEFTQDICGSARYVFYARPARSVELTRGGRQV